MSKHLMLKHFPTSILEESRIKVVIVGDSGVGKTTFLVK